MLSFLYWLSRGYERSHGVRANVLYISRAHFERLRHEFSDPHDSGAIVKLLGLTIMISDEAVHPHLAHIDRSARPRAARPGTHAPISRLPAPRAE